MANIILTTECDRDCAYCFASGVRKAGSRSRLDRKALEVILRYLKDSGARSVNVLGGEPTLHKELPDFLDMMSARGIFATLFTNGLFNTGTARMLASKKDLRIVFNVNSPQAYRKEQWSRLMGNLRLLKDKASIAHTIASDKEDLGFLVDVLLKNGVTSKTLRIGISNPVYKGDNLAISREDQRAVIKKVVALSKTAKKRGISIYLDCGFELCLFSKKDISELFMNAATDMKLILCKPLIDILPSLEVCYCMALGDKKLRVKLTDFRSIREVEDYFNRRFAVYKAIGNKDKCFKCLFRVRGQCSGGCLSRALIANDAGMAS